MDSFWAPLYTNRLETLLLYSSKRHFSRDNSIMNSVKAVSLSDARFSCTTLLMI